MSWLKRFALCGGTMVCLMMRSCWHCPNRDPDMGQCYTLGKALTERAALELADNDQSWK